MSWWSVPISWSVGRQPTFLPRKFIWLPWRGRASAIFQCPESLPSFLMVAFLISSWESLDFFRCFSFQYQVYFINEFSSFFHIPLRFYLFAKLVLWSSLLISTVQFARIARRFWPIRNGASALLLSFQERSKASWIVPHSYLINW